jgi:microcystin-dependent protein
LGWLIRNGQAVSSATYPNLYKVIGTKYGIGDGTVDGLGNIKDFNVPDDTGLFIRGYKAGLSADFGKTQPSGAPNITGTTAASIDLWSFRHVFTGAFHKETWDSSARNANDMDGGAVTRIHFSAQASNEIYGAASEIRPPNRNYLPIIKASYELEGLDSDANKPLVPDLKVCMFTINPTPSNAEVILSADGLVQQGNGINVVSGTTVTYEVSADGYETRTGTYEVLEDTILPIILEVGMVTLAIETSVEDAVVKLSATGYTQDGNSITVLNGTLVSYSITADGYYPESGSQKVVESNMMFFELEKLKYNTTVKTLKPTTLGTYDSADVGKAVIRSDADNNNSLINKLYNGYEWSGASSYDNLSISSSLKNSLVSAFAKPSWSSNKTKLTLWVGHTEINQPSKIVLSISGHSVATLDDYVTPYVYGTNDGGTWTPLTISTYSYVSAKLLPPVPPYSKKYDTSYDGDYKYYLPSTEGYEILGAQSQHIIRLTINMDTTLNSPYYLHKILLQIGNGKTNWGVSTQVTQMSFTTNVKTIAPRS